MFACAWADKPSFLGLSFKTCLALAQTFGYAAGKVPSILFSPKLPHSQLRGALVMVVLAAGTCVTLSSFTPALASLALVWFACVWLAPAWSLLQRFLEGRQYTEAIYAVVSFAYIGASGLCKGLAVDLVAFGYSDAEATAICALAGTAVGMLAAVGVAAQPPPSAADVAKRGRRKEMLSYRKECAQLGGDFGPGIVLVVCAYTLLGALRAYRDYFQLELFVAVGLSGKSSLFAASEFSVSLVVLLASAGFGLVDDNRRAIDVILRVAMGGGLLLAALTHLHELGKLGGLEWIIGVGAACFLAYVPLGTMLFERVLAAAQLETTSSLLSLVMDATVLVGTASLLCYKDFVQAADAEDAPHMHAFYCTAARVGGLLVALLLALANVALGRAVDRKRLARSMGRLETAACKI